MAALLVGPGFPVCFACLQLNRHFLFSPADWRQWCTVARKGLMVNSAYRSQIIIFKFLGILLPLYQHVPQLGYRKTSSHSFLNISVFYCRCNNDESMHTACRLLHQIRRSASYSVAIGLATFNEEWPFPGHSRSWLSSTDACSLISARKIWFQRQHWFNG